jgi:hypothetical protein
LLVWGIAKKDWKIYLPGFIATGNVILLFYSVFIIRQLYALHLFAREYGIPGNSVNDYPGWFELRTAAIILLPLLFLFKSLSANRWLTLLMLVLLNWTRLIAPLYHKRLFLFNIYYDSSFLVKILNYLCLLMSGYALLWLLKRLPHQQVK